MNNKELAGLLLTAAEVCDDALEPWIGDDLRAAADELEKAAEGVEPVAPAPAVSVPDGWQLVPEIPTDDMMIAGLSHHDYHNAYQAMIAAAPQPEES